MQENFLDQVRLNFSPEGLVILNIILGFIMFGVALELKIQHFRDLLKAPRVYIAGITSQFIFLPLITFLLILLLNPMPGIALGMILVASCPGGNISNFFSSLAKGNIAFSVSLTALSTLLAVIMTPLNFSVWGGLYLGIGNSPGSISLNPADIFMNILLILGVPVLVGMLFSEYFPQITKKIITPIKKALMGIFILFVIVAFSNNYEAFINYIHLVFGLVFLHNLFAVLTGYFTGASFGLKKVDKRTIAIETGIQNSGLGLIIVFTFMGGIGSMAIVAAWWGIWHIISGFFLAFLWSKKPLAYTLR
jgi:BASS family bile acid:Na+ symporter